LARLTVDELASVLTLDEFETLAQHYMTPAAYSYVAGGAGSELTIAENRAAFNRIRLNPRVLIDVTTIDTTLYLFGRKYEYPILLAPAGYHKLVHPDGEIETVKGANLAEATLVASIFSTVTVEEMNAIATRPLWFQIYIQTDRGFTKALVDRAVAAGCEAICVTVDVPVNGPRDRELHAGFKLPRGVERANLSSLGTAISAASHRPVGRNIYAATHGADVTWKDIEWLRQTAPVKLLLKGILHPEDAELAIKAGCDGIIVSNHGGRSVDTVAASIDALPAIIAAVEGRLPVLLDGGIRRGIDVFKALARGATATMIGRSYLYGLSVGGAFGVSRAVEILRTELEMTMGLVGCTALSQITERYLL
jgi:4-hydroxymandelate oxidase